MGKKSRRRPAAAKEKKQQVGNESNGETNVENPKFVRPASIHELDNLKAAVEWMSKGRVDTKGFAKHLPHTSQALQEGKVTPQEVARDLEGVYTVRTCRLAGHEISPWVGIAQMCAMSALPLNFFQSEKHLADVSFLFSGDLETRFTKRFKAEANEENSSLILKECVDATCEKWAPRLDRELFRGKKGTFLKRCPLYGVDPQEYWHEDMPMRRYYDGLDHFHEHRKEAVSEMRKGTILDAAKNVALGSHDISRKCWECNTVSQDLKNCSKCEAAQYCSRECQLSAWKKGHKHKCKLLGCKYVILDESLKAIDEYHNSGKDNNFVKKGLSLSDEIDFRVLDMAITCGLPIGGEDEGFKLGMPSMWLYYKNLERVALGEIWFFPNASEERYQAVRLDVESESNYFLILCEALCFDYDLMMNSFVRRFCHNIFAGLEMPASAFMDIYFRCGKKTQGSADRCRLRREHKNKMIQFFMEKDHT